MHCVSDSDVPDDGPDDFDFSELFGADPNAMMAQFMSLFSGLGSGGSDGLDQALQIAMSIAAGGATEPNVDPVERMQLEQLARVAELQIEQATGLRGSHGTLTIAPVTRGEWVKRSMEAYRPILEKLGTAMSDPLDAGPPIGDEASDPQMAMFEQLFTSLRPMMTNMTTGSMVGHIGSRALGTYDLPIPRPASDELLVVVPNLNAFDEEWSLDADDLRMWIALSEVAHHAVLSVPHVAERLSNLLDRYVEAFRSDPKALEESLGGFEISPSGDFTDIQDQLQSMFGDPTALIGALRSPEQEAVLPELSAVCGTIVGYVDHIMDSIGERLIASYGQLTEALRRRRVTASQSDRFVEKLLGLELDQQLYDDGRAFVDGVVERAGEDSLRQLWESAENLPTPAEMSAPGLWLARLGVDFELDVEAEVEYELSDEAFNDDDESD